MANFLQLDNLPGGHGGATGGNASNVGLNTAVSNVTATINSSGISIDARGYAGTTTAITGNAAITLNSGGLNFNGAGLAGTTTAITGGAVITLNSAGLQFNGAGLAGTTTAITGNASITLNSAGFQFNGSGLAGTTTAVTGNASITLNSSGIQFNGSNLAGVITGATNGSITANSSGISINVALPTISSYTNIPWTNSSGMTLGDGAMHQCVAINIPQAISMSFVRVPMRMSTTQVTNYSGNNSFTSGGGFLYSTCFALFYKMNAGASSQSLSLVASSSNRWTVSHSYSYSSANSAWSVTQGINGNAYGSAITAGSSTQYSQTSVSLNWSTGMFTNFSSLRMLDIDFASSLSAGPYWLMVMISTSTTTSGQVNMGGGVAVTNNGVTFSNLWCASQNNNAVNAMGDTGLGGSAGGMFGCGQFSTAGSGTTASLHVTAISSTLSNPALMVTLLRQA